LTILSHKGITKISLFGIKSIEIMRTYTLRIDEDLLNKLKYIAKYEKRSVNSQIMMLIKKFIADFEKTEKHI